MLYLVLTLVFGGRWRRFHDGFAAGAASFVFISCHWCWCGHVDLVLICFGNRFPCGLGSLVCPRYFLFLAVARTAFMLVLLLVLPLGRPVLPLVFDV